ncbi:arylsulfatase [Flavobacteriaceae bacterium GF1]
MLEYSPLDNRHKLKETKMKILLLGLSVLFLSCNTKEKGIGTDSEDNSPNIVLILADDMGWSDLGCYGSEINTPVLDSLAYTGHRFTQFYNTSKCFPSRAALLTGLYAQQVGVGRSWKPNWQQCTTIAAELKNKGYRTYMAGKHHGVDVPTDSLLGFDAYYGLLSGSHNQFNPGEQRPGEPKPAQKRVRPFYVDGQRYEPYTPDSTYYSTDAFTDWGITYITEAVKEEFPFFLYLSYTAPHDPLMAWPEDIAKYRGKYKVGYEAIRQRRFERQKELGLISDDFELYEPTHVPWHTLSEAEQDTEDLKMAIYAAMVDRLDQNIGRVMNTLRHLGQLENTIILFISDNGSSAEVVELSGDGKIGTVGQWTSLGGDWANVSNTPFRMYKNNSYEGGINSPAIINWAKLEDQNVIHHAFYGHFIDVFPTLLGLIDHPYEVQEKVLPTEGISFEAILRGKDTVVDRPLFFEWSTGAAARKGEWKIVREGDDWELYHLATDPGETNNLARTHTQELERMVKLFKLWKERMEAQSPIKLEGEAAKYEENCWQLDS